MWKSLGGIKDAVKEGISEFSRDALKESGEMAHEAAPVVKRAANSAASKAGGVAKSVAARVRKPVPDNTGAALQDSPPATHTPSAGADSATSSIDVLRDGADDFTWGDDFDGNAPLPLLPSSGRLVHLDGDVAPCKLGPSPFDSMPAQLADADPPAGNQDAEPFADKSISADASPLGPSSGPSLEAARQSRAVGKSICAAEVEDLAARAPVIGQPTERCASELTQHAALPSSRIPETSGAPSPSLSKKQHDMQGAATVGDAPAKAGKSRTGDKAELERLETLTAELRRDLRLSTDSELKLKQQLGQSNARAAAAQAMADQLQARAQALESTVHSQRFELQAKQEAGEEMEARVEQLAASLEARMTQLTAELEERDAEVATLNEEKEAQRVAFEEVRHLLKQSVGERERLSEATRERDEQIAQLKEWMQEAEARAEAARALAQDTSSQLAEQRARLAAQAVGGMSAEAKNALQKQVHESLARQQEAEEHVTSLQSKLAEAERRATAEEAMRVRCAGEAAEAKAERARAEAQAAAERAERDSAVIERNRLLEDSERRARAFNEAVKKAVGKIQGALEFERDDLKQKCAKLSDQLKAAREEAEAAAAAQELAEVAANQSRSEADAAEVAMIAAETAATRAASLADARARQLAQLAKAAEESKYSAQSLQAACALHEARVKEVEAELAELSEQKSREIELLVKEQEEAKSRLDEFILEMESRVKAAQLAAAAREAECASYLEATTQATERADKLQLLLNEKEEVAAKNLQDFNRELDAKGGLSGLGLETMNLRIFQESMKSSTDVESASVIESSSKVPKRLLPKSRNNNEIGKISTRSMMMLIYLMALHLLVMWSFAPRKVPQCSNELRLP